MAKPTKAYLELMAKLKRDQEAEHQMVAEAAIEKAEDRRIEMDLQRRLMTEQTAQIQKEKAYKAFSEFTTDMKSQLLEGVLSILAQKALPKVVLEFDNNREFTNGVVREFVRENGASKLLSNMRTKTQLLSEIADEVESSYEDAVEDASADDPDSLIEDPNVGKDLISKIEDSEDINDVTDIIRNKVSRATEEFVEKNVMDQTEIKGTLADAKERMSTVRTGDDAVDEEIRQEAADMAKKKIRDIRNRPHTVFEQLCMNMSEAVIRNKDTHQQYFKEDGTINMDKIVDRCRCVYTVMETVNTLKIKQFTPEDIEHFITFE